MISSCGYWPCSHGCRFSGRGVGGGPSGPVGTCHVPMAVGSVGGGGGGQGGPSGPVGTCHVAMAVGSRGGGGRGDPQALWVLAMLPWL